MYNLMTPGPTRLADNVRNARAMQTINPDEEFYKYYMETCNVLLEMMNSKGRVHIMTGEGILGLEAVCASLTEKNDRVLILENGVFGKGFADFVELYGGEPVIYSSSYKKPFDSADIKKFLEKDSDFKYATIVHCDTPSGVLNDIEVICNILKQHGIITVVDSVAAMFAVPVDIEKYKIDVLCGGSQKALSAATGLSMVWVSQDAIDIMKSRKTQIPSYYANVLTFEEAYKGRFFPYSQPTADIYSLRTAIENVRRDSGIFERHKKIASATRKTITSAGLELYLENGYSDTVTVVKVPDGLTDREILDTLKNEHKVIIAGSFDILTGKVFRIGHMGENAREEYVAEALGALNKTLEKLNYNIDSNMKETFLKEINK